MAMNGNRDALDMTRFDVNMMAAADSIQPPTVFFQQLADLFAG